MADFNIIPDYHLATGGALDQSGPDPDALWAAGIRAIIDCQLEYDDGPLLIKHPGMKYIWLPVSDDGQPKAFSWFEAGYDFAYLQIHPVVVRDEIGITYAHCAAGINRGPSMCYFLLRSLWGLDPAAAELAIRAVRPQVGIAYKADADRAWTQLFSGDSTVART